MKLQLTMRYAIIVGTMLVVFIVPVSIGSFYYQIGGELAADVNALKNELNDPILPAWFERLYEEKHGAEEVEPYSHREIRRFAIYALTATVHADIPDEVPLFMTYFWHHDGLSWAINSEFSSANTLWRDADNGQFYYFRTYKQWINQQHYLIAVAIPITTAVQILFTVLIALPIALLLSTLGGYWLINRALQPLRDITRKVEHINAEQIVTHLVVANPHDEIGQLAQALNHSLDRIDQSFQHLKNFTADAAHQLRTPLTIIHNVGELSMQHPMTAAHYRESMGSVLEESNKLQQVIDTLLLLTQRDSGNISQSPVQCDDISPFVADIVEMLQAIADEKQQQIRLTSNEKVPVYMDEGLLEQALINIIHNAILYTPVGGTISIMCATHPQSTITIADNGAGVTLQDAAHIFDRFYRGDVPDKQSGTGLGLAVARQAIRLAGGDVQLLNAGEQGAIFQVTCYVI
jgi:signal transduction histidine kinase